LIWRGNREEYCANEYLFVRPALTENAKRVSAVVGSIADLDAGRLRQH
jgi:hypothetical protein